MPLGEWSMGFRAPFSWLVALGCIALAWRRFSLLERLNPPTVSVLLEELLSEFERPEGETARRFAIAELNQRISDVSFQLSLSPVLYQALVRVCLASGPALALLGFIDFMAPTMTLALIRSAVCALSGFVGAGIVVTIGRAARVRVTEIRAAWDRCSREAGKTLGTELEPFEPSARLERAERK